MVSATKKRSESGVGREKDLGGALSLSLSSLSGFLPLGMCDCESDESLAKRYVNGMLCCENSPEMTKQQRFLLRG